MNSIHKYSLENISIKQNPPSPAAVPSKLKSIFKNLTPHHKSTDHVPSSGIASDKNNSSTGPEVFFYNKNVSKLFNTQNDKNDGANNLNIKEGGSVNNINVGGLPSYIRQNKHPHAANFNLYNRRNSRSEENLNFSERQNCFGLLSPTSGNKLLVRQFFIFYISNKCFLVYHKPI